MSSPEEKDNLAPAVILVAPQLGENIGTAARAMANFGLTRLRLVRPRDGWPNEKARAAASGANHVIDTARIFETLADAVADLAFVYATTARAREVAKPVAGPHEAGARLRALARANSATGVIFGPERAGLNNDDLSHADEIVTFPVDPTFSSINIAQSVLLIGYEWRRSGLTAGDAGLPFTLDRELAPKADLFRLFDHLESSLDASGFFRPPEKRTHMVEGLRSILQRAELSEQEVRTLRGVIASLERRHVRTRSDS
ncbi:MAG: RNA methyltransferase [Hyphomicrobiales bacterium]|nr:RNA methyltransferase [Hyphomicrobiales bacterium]